MELLSRKGRADLPLYPVKVLQFGEGNFLRAFVDWQIQKMNQKADFHGGVAIVQPLPRGRVGELKKQDLLYTLYLRGMENGRPADEHEVISCVSAAVNPYAEFGDFLALAGCETLRFIVSNTTEAGIAFRETDRFSDRPQSSYPGKLTRFLYQRFLDFEADETKGFFIIPCELIDRNGEKLREIVLRYAGLWNLGSEFLRWLTTANTFCCSLVDRIVPGYPREEIGKITRELGYADRLADVAERFHLWVIEGPAGLSRELPFEKAGLNVKIVEDMTPYRTRKVRILNGSHTVLLPVAYLLGLDTVGEAVGDPIAGAFLKRALYQEIIPTLSLPKAELETFAAAVLERFANPFIKHGLMSIALNSFSKFRTRVLPSILTYQDQNGRLPALLVFSFAALLIFYCGKRDGERIPLNDEQPVLNLMGRLWNACNGTENGIGRLVREALAFEYAWGGDLNRVPGLTEAVSADVRDILTLGMKEAVRRLD